MPSSSTSNSKRGSILRRLILFAGGLGLSYLIAVMSMSNVPIGKYNFFQLAIGDATIPHKFGHTFQRFEEIEQFRDIDILFAGSSHSFRSFDPDVISRLGWSSFNTGSNSQAPINTYHLLETYLDQLRPKLVILEVYPLILERDGVEGYFDLLANRPVTGEAVDVCLELGNKAAVNALVGRYAGQLFESHDPPRQEDVPHEKYVSGGYVWAKMIYVKDYWGEGLPIVPREEQVEYLHRSIDLVKGRGAGLLFTIVPMPLELVAAIPNYAEISTLLESIAAEHAVAFYDFNRTMVMDTRTEFRDHHHLNGNGAKVFTYVLVDSLLAIADTSRTMVVESQYAADLYCGRAIAAAQRGNPQAALNDMERAIALDSTMHRAWLNRALIYQFLKRYDQAIADYDRAAECDPTSAVTFLAKGELCETIGQHRKARDAYEHFLAIAGPEFNNKADSIRQRFNGL